MRKFSTTNRGVNANSRICPPREPANSVVIRKTAVLMISSHLTPVGMYPKKDDLRYVYRGARITVSNFRISERRAGLDARDRRRRRLAAFSVAVESSRAQLQ